MIKAASPSHQTMAADPATHTRPSTPSLAAMKRRLLRAVISSKSAKNPRKTLATSDIIDAPLQRLPPTPCATFA